MALLNDILEWVGTLPEWQSDAARRLFQNDGDLSEDDYAELYVLLKAAHELPDAGEPVAVPLTSDHLPAEATPEATVMLKAMRDLENVNRIAPSQSLSFSETGVTIIYGGNGSGKSGYARVLKSACRARDQSEQVHPNVSDSKTVDAVPTAKFDIEVAGVAEELSWSRDEVFSLKLSTIAVFDSRCARHFITKERDVAYLPYGLNVVEGLANKVFPELLQRLNNEIEGLDIDTRPFEYLKGDTEVGKQINGLAVESDPEIIKALGTLSETEILRFAELNKALAEVDPIAKANDLKLSASRLKELGDKVIEPIAWVSDASVEKLRKLDEVKCAAEVAEKKAAEAFQAGEKLLPKTGEQAWKLLFEAARKYSAEAAYPGHEFPHIEDASCPLCQETLNKTAGQRLIRFEQYIKDDVARNAKEQRQSLETIKTKIENAELGVGLDATITREITILDESLISVITAFRESIDARKNAMLASLSSHNWSSIVELAENPRRKIRSLAAQQLRTSRTFARASDEERKKKLTIERTELEARMNLSNCLDVVLSLLQRIKRKSALEKCRVSLKTRSISDKSKEFTSKAVTDELRKALSLEFNALGIGHIQTRLKERNVRGEMLHQLILDSPTTHGLDIILSEGEQRSIALGSFLAELALANHSCGIIFDDPVSSLDHKRRGKVAKRLIQESSKRQVIVFTHDIVFLDQLRDECDELNIESTVSSLEWNGAFCGSINPGLPWSHMSYMERIDSHEKERSKFSKLPWPADPSEELSTQIVHEYDLLRATIERVVQDFILNRTVQRFKDYIKVDNLQNVVGLQQSEVDKVFRLYKRCHRIVDSHDPSSAKNGAPPTPDDLKQDIDGLRQIIETIRARRKATVTTTGGVTK